MALFVAISSSYIFRASVSASSLLFNTLSTAQKRFTAVGLAALISSAAFCKSAPSSSAKAIAKPAERLKTEYWQVRIIYKRTVKVGSLKKETVIPFEFASPMICRTHDEAVGFAPHYIYELIKAGDLPKDVILFGNEIDYDKIKVGIQKLEIALMERDVSDK